MVKAKEDSKKTVTAINDSVLKYFSLQYTQKGLEWRPKTLEEFRYSYPDAEVPRNMLSNWPQPAVQAHDVPRSQT